MDPKPLHVLERLRRAVRGPSQARNRRGFMAMMGRIALALVAMPVELWGWQKTPFQHPEPRPDVDGSRVLGRDQVAPHLADLFDGVRAIPHIVDGIGCHCGCSLLEGMRSLLSCYEGVGMAQGCHICEGEGRLAVRLHAEGEFLDEIRDAIDREFG